jgi:hypothetical protein
VEEQVEEEEEEEGLFPFNPAQPPLDTHPNCARSVNLCFLLFFRMGVLLFFKSATGGPIEKMSPPTTR